MFLEIVKKSLNIFIIRILSILSGFLFTYFLAQFYGSNGMGIFVLCQSILMISILVSLFGTDIASVKLISKYFFKRNYFKIKSIYINILQIVIPISITVSIFIYTIRLYISKLIFHDPNLEVGIYYSIFCILPLCLVYIHSESLRGMKEVELYAILKYLLIPILSIVFLFILYDSSNIHIPVLSYFIAILITSIISFLIWTFKSQFFKIKINTILLIIAIATFIFTPIIIGLAIYYGLKKIGFPNAAKWTTITYTLVIIIGFSAILFEDKFFFESDALELIGEQNLKLNNDFEIKNNRTMTAIGEYYHTFTLAISPIDHKEIISKMIKSENFITNSYFFFWFI